MKTQRNRQWVWGTAMILLGAGWLTNNLGLTHIQPSHVFAIYWPVLFIFPGLSLLLSWFAPQPGNRRHTIHLFMAVLLLAVAGVVLAKNLGFISGSASSLLGNIIGPVLILVVGISFLFKQER